MKRPRGFDPGVIRGCLHGDDGAWRTLVAEHVGLVTGIFRRLLARRGVSMDKTFIEEQVATFFADLCLNREKALGEYRGDGPFDAYLAVMAANFIRGTIDAVEQESQNLEVYAAQISLDRSSGDRPPLEPHQIDGVLGACTAEERLLYRLVYVDGATTEEVAALLGISRAAVYLRKHRFHAKVKSLLGGRSMGPESSPQEGEG